MRHRIKCPSCKYEWWTKTEKIPVECTRCKRYFKEDEEIFVKKNEKGGFYYIGKAGSYFGLSKDEFDAISAADNAEDKRCLKRKKYWNKNEESNDKK